MHELELNFSNVCFANCYICSKSHGSGNVPFMTDEVFNALKEQIKDIEIDIIQTSGNGECWLHPKFYQYITELKEVKPSTPFWNYNNFSMMDKDRADKIIKNKMFDKLHVRIDSLNPVIQEKSQNLNPATQMRNILYFLENSDIEFVILYSDIKQYFDKCNRVLGKQPQYDPFNEKDWEYIHDEEREVIEFFSRFNNVTVCRINQSLWGERIHATPDYKTVCKRLSILESVCWLHPNGNVGTCPYDDQQSFFTCGNILENNLLDIWNGPERKEYINNIKNKKYNGKYPCINPNCCTFGG